MATAGRGSVATGAHGIALDDERTPMESQGVEASVASLQAWFPGLCVKNTFLQWHEGGARRTRSSSAPAGFGGRGAVDHVALATKAIGSLYLDALKPECVLVRRRIQEMRGLLNMNTAQWSPEFLAAVCEAAGLRVVREKKKSHSAFAIFNDALTTPDFVDPRGDNSVLPCEAYEEVVSYVQGEGWDEVHRVTTCNYELAKVLQHDIAGLQKFRLGDVWQLVHRLVREKLVGHRRMVISDKVRVFLVPFERSDEHRKLKEATSTPSEDWSQLRDRMRALVLRSKNGSGLLLSGLKKNYRREFGAELHEGWYGFVKLSDLLMHEFFKTVCTLVHEGSEARILPPI